jgi:4-aminobutyrate aminotransferase-like enzyme
MTMINAFDAKTASHLSAEDAALIERRQKLLGPAYRLFYQNPVHLVRGQGVYLYDKQGTQYLDAYNNVACIGHCHPRVTQAIAAQLALLNTHTRYLHEDVLAYAERLLATLPEALGHIMFTCTGSEANDLALRIARAHTGNQGIIVTRLAYHGVTSALAELSPSLGQAVPLGKTIRLIDAPDYYRGHKAVGETMAANIKAAIADMAQHGIKPAALLVDTIFSSDGVFSHPIGFLKPAVAAIKEAGGLFIADEVQAGFGRLGAGLWGFARHGVEPDIVTMGKPMGNGHPLAAMACKPEVIAAFGTNTRYFNTFGGNPVSVAAGQAVLDVIEQEGLITNAKRVGEILRQGLNDLAIRYDCIGDVRGAGLFIGVELVSNRSTKTPDAKLSTAVVNALREKHILISAAGPHANILKIRPPLPFSSANADQLLSTLSAVLKQLTGSVII